MDELIEKIRKLKFEKKYTNKEIVNALNTNINLVKRVTCKRYDKILQNKKIKQQKEYEFVELIKKYLPFSNSINNLCYNLGIRSVEGYYKKIKEIIKKYNLSTSHFGTLNLRNRNYRQNFTIITDADYFVSNKKRDGKSTIKRLVNGKYKEYKCEICGINEWKGKPLTLQIHHINGNHYDNKIENLQILCPNCHSQTNTYAKRKKNKYDSFFNAKDFNLVKNEVELKRKKYCIICGNEIVKGNKKYCSKECAQIASHKFEVTSAQLINDFKELKTFCAVGKKYNVSDNAIKKRCKKLGILDDISQYITHRGKKL